MPFTVACAQFAPKKAEVEANLDQIAEITRQAVAEGADLVVFPEAGTSGYFLEGGVFESALGKDDLRCALDERLKTIRGDFDLVVGFYETDGGELFNSVAYLSRAAGKLKLEHVYRKFFLPTYGVFDEERFVGRGHEVCVFETRFGRVGLLICEDVWHSILPTLCAMQGAEIILVPSASPARGFSGDKPDNLERYERLLRGISEEHGVYCVNAMLCGFEGGKGLVGGSMVIDPFGRVLREAPIQEPHLLLCEIDLEQCRLARSASPLISDLHNAWGDIRRIVDSIKP